MTKAQAANSKVPAFIFLTNVEPAAYGRVCIRTEHISAINSGTFGPRPDVGIPCTILHLTGGQNIAVSDTLVSVLSILKLST